MMRPSVRRLLPLALLPFLLSGSLVPSRATRSASASPTLSVRAVSPSPDAQEVTAATAIVVAFDRPVVALVGVGEQPPSPLVSEPPLGGKGRWVTSSIYSWQATNLRAATRYTLRTPAGLRAIDGTRLAQPYVWSFATVRPAVRDVSPGDGYGYALPRPLITLTFNQGMDHTATEAAFHLRDAQGRDVPGVFSWKDGAMRFQPVPTLARTATYTASLDGSARSAEGPLPLLQPITWHFSVAPYLRITGSTPRDGNPAADTSQGVEVDFNAPIDEASAIGAVRISPDVPGRYISFGDDDLSLHIYGSFAPSTAYTVQVKAGLLARAGDRLSTPFGMRFVSAPLPPQLYFVTGNVASYDAYRPLILSLQAINPGTISYTVYRLDRDGFVADLTNQYDLRNRIPGSGDEVLSFSRQPNAPLNKATPIQVQLLLSGGRPLPPGYYVVRAAGNLDAVDYQLLVVTRTNLTLKVAQRQVLVWATDLASGQPVPDLPLRIIAQYGDSVPGAGAGGAIAGSPVIAAGRTTANGTMIMNVPGVPDNQSLADSNLLAIGERGGDVAAVGASWNSGVSPSDYGLDSSSYQAPRRLSLYTDRPIYRPGQVVHARGLVRADDDGQYSLVSGPVSLVLTDPKGQIASRQTVILDQFGAFHADFTLAGNASLGGYSLSASSGDQGTYASLQVAEYRKPTFTVTVSATRGTYTVGEYVDADVEVAYYFGGPVAHARVHWSMLGYTYTFFPYGYDDYSFGAYDPAAVAGGIAAPICIDCPRQPGYTLYQGDATTDANGRLHLHLPARLPAGQTMQSYSLEANVTDLDNQPVAGNTGLTIFASAFQIGLQPERQIVDPGVAQRVRIVTVRDDGAGGVPNQQVQVAIYRRTYSNVVIHHKDGSVDQPYVPHDTLLSTQTVQTDHRGQTSITFTAPKGGEYHLVASARDRFGNRTESSVEIYAGGEKPIDWGFQQQGHIRLVTDKRTYHSGDVAHILVTTPFPNMLALISIERGHILTYRVQRLAGTGTRLDVPVPTSYLPDTYVSVVVEQGASVSGPPPVWRMGYARIHVDTQERAIRLTVSPAHPRVQPGQPVPLRIHAVDYRGRPVQAQLSLSVVDAAALALAGDSGSGADLLDTFYGDRPLGVMTANTLNISPEQLLTKRVIPTRAFAANQGQGQGAGGEARVPASASPAPASADHAANTAKSVPGGGPAISVRMNFADTAFWSAAVLTDASGNATLTVPLPDNTTTWQILGQGITSDTLVGAGTGSVMATKDLLLRPLLPRFFTLGDTAMIGATINNTTDHAVTAHLRLLLADGAPGLALAPTGERTIRLAAHGEQDVTWQVRLGALGTATVQVQAIDADRPATNDAVQLALPVTENSTPEDVATAGEAGANTQEAVVIPAGIEPDEGSLTVSLEPTLAAGLRVGADFLRTYPYESSIDLSAKILGEAELGRLPARAAVLNPAEQAQLRPEIVRLLNLLSPMQHGDGGYGWWIDDPYSSPYITVYVVAALTVARDLGYPVDGTALNNAVRYLLANARMPAATNAGVDYDANLQAEIVYAVTRYGRGADVVDLGAALFDARYLLDHFAKADLAVALWLRHTAAADAQVKTLLADLVSAARLSGTSAHWDESAYDWQALDSDIAGTAIILDALTVIDPHNPLIANTVRWLMAARTANAWESTEATAASLRGLVDYIMASGELNGHYRYAVRLNGAAWGSGVVDAGNLTQIRTLTQAIGPRAPAGSTQRIAVGRDVRPGNGQLHYVIRLQYYRPVDRIAPVSEGVSVTRRYLTADGRSAPLGSAVRVQLTVTAPQDLFYLVLEDPLPAGAESVDSSLHTTTQLAQIQSRSTIPPGTGDLTWYVTHTDLRDNRTVLFLDYLPAGTYQYAYLIHCSTQGVFHTLPTHIQQSYFPEVFGRSNGSYFKVR